jgi:hypothetical protein
MQFVVRTLWNVLSIIAGCAALTAPCAAECPCRGGGSVQFASQPGAPPGYPIAPTPDPAFRPQPQVVPVPMAPGASPPPQSYPIPPQPPPIPTQPQQFPQPPPLPQPPPPGSPTPLNAPMPHQDAAVDRPPAVNRFDVAPPPGTLGRTYQRRSRLIDDDKHPRWAAVEVRLPEEVDVSSRGLKASWTGEVWRLEVESPLLPGVPHVYAIKAERDAGNGEKSVDVRWVRLISGRVVELEF